MGENNPLLTVPSDTSVAPQVVQLSFIVVEKSQYDALIMERDLYRAKYFELVTKLTATEEELKATKEKLQLVETQLFNTIMRCTLFYE
jgi:hypothetical protein